jgi:hypothetical protein
MADSSNTIIIKEKNGRSLTVSATMTASTIIVFHNKAEKTTQNITTYYH